MKSAFYRSALATIGIGLAMTFAPGPDARAAEHTRVTNPNALSLELFGRGLLYGLSFDRVMSDELAAGISYGRTPLDDLNGEDTGSGASLIPVYLNYYFMRDGNSPFITAGATVNLSGDEAEGKKAAFSGLEFTGSTSVLPTFGLGFESRGDTSFLFRVTGYGIVGRTLAPWFGFTMGYCF